ncbi:MAG: DctP family TRAP transporter solute-binding subunit [Desulfovibrio sp.]|nr:DctP family TRAP transporter solute-binding subunit [Desulfovibrio sp.]
MVKGILSVLFLLLSVQLCWAQFNFKLGHIAEPENPYGQGAVYFAKLVHERTNGEVTIEVYPSSQLGNQRQLVDKLSNGTLDLTLTGTAVLGNFVPEVSVFDLPFLFRDRAHAYKILDTLGMEVCAIGENKGMITLAIWENGLRHFTNNRRPIVVPEDMRGLTFRVMEQPIYIEMMKSLGATPISMSLKDLYEALQSNIVDGQENPLAHIATKKFYEVQKYLSLSAHTYAAEVLLISKEAWNKLNREQQKIVREVACEVRDWQRELCQKKEAEYLAIIRASGKCEINENVDRKSFSEVTHKVWQIYTKKYGDKWLRAVLASD